MQAKKQARLILKDDGEIAKTQAMVDSFAEVQALPQQGAIFHVIREIVRVLEPALLLFAVAMYIALLITFPVVSLLVMALTIGIAWFYRRRFPTKNNRKNSDYRLRFVDLLSEVNDKGYHYQQPGHWL